MSHETKRTLKIISLTSVGIALSFFAFYFLRVFAESEEVSAFVLFAVFSWFLLAFIALETLFFERGKGMMILLVLQGFIPALAFLPYLWNNFSFIFFGVGVFALFLILGVVSGAKKIENSVRIRFFPTTFKVLSRVSTGFVILVLAFSYVYFFQLNKLTEEKVESLFGAVLRVSDPVLNFFLPGISFEMSLREAMSEIEQRKILEEQKNLIRSEGAFGEESKLTTEERIEKAIEKFEQTVGEYVGAIDETVPIGSVVFEFLNNRIGDFSDGAKSILEASLIVPLFFLFKLVIFFLYIPIQITAFVFYKILVLSGFAYVIYEDKNKEVIRLFESYGPSAEDPSNSLDNNLNNNLLSRPGS